MDGTITSFPASDLGELAHYMTLTCGPTIATVTVGDEVLYAISESCCDLDSREYVIGRLDGDLFFPETEVFFWKGATPSQVRTKIERALKNKRSDYRPFVIARPKPMSREAQDVYRASMKASGGNQ